MNKIHNWYEGWIVTAFYEQYEGVEKSFKLPRIRVGRYGKKSWTISPWFYYLPYAESILAHEENQREKFEY